jgi:hypothetical protein
MSQIPHFKEAFDKTNYIEQHSSSFSLEILNFRDLSNSKKRLEKHNKLDIYYDRFPGHYVPVHLTVILNIYGISDNLTHTIMTVAGRN